MEGTYKKSKAWWFIAAALVALLLFVFMSTTVIGQSEAKALDPVPANVLLPFFIACIALAMAIGANVSAYLNPRSSLPARILSPIVIALVFIIVIPFFVSIGLTVVS